MKKLESWQKEIDEIKEEIKIEKENKRDFGQFDDYEKSNWIERITKYEELRELYKHEKQERERQEDLLIKKVNKLDAKINAILDVIKDINDKMAQRRKKQNKD